MGLLIWLVEGGVNGIKNWQSFNHRQGCFFANGWWSLKAAFGQNRTPMTAQLTAKSGQ